LRVKAAILFFRKGEKMKTEQKAMAGDWAERLADMLSATATLAHLAGTSAACQRGGFARCENPNCVDRRQMLVEFDGWRDRAKETGTHISASL
jgi:hypothetical protein